MGKCGSKRSFDCLSVETMPMAAGVGTIQFALIHDWATDHTGKHNNIIAKNLIARPCAYLNSCRFQSKNRGDKKRKRNSS